MDYDIVVVGAGPAGLSFALSLKNSGLKVLVLEKNTEKVTANPAPDGREIALTHLSIKLLKKLDCWAYLLERNISPIRRAKVVNGNSSYALDFRSENTQALGYLVPNYLIREVLYQKTHRLAGVDFRYEASVVNLHTDETQAQVILDTGERITAKLVVAADSRFSASRRTMGIGTSTTDFARTAIVCRMRHEKSHEHTAFECFHYGGTLAILPMHGQMSSAVITVKNTDVDEILAMSEEAFGRYVTARLSGQLGAMQLEGQRHHYPLVAVHAKQFVSTRFALLGDAAVGMHPVTAHGFNLGLRAQESLASLIVAAQRRGADIGAHSVLKPYETRHMQVTKPLYWGTNGIVALFTNDSEPAKLIRKAVMHLANNFPPLKSAIVHKLTETQGSAFLPKLPKLPKLPFARE